MFKDKSINMTLLMGLSTSNLFFKNPTVTMLVNALNSPNPNITRCWLVVHTAFLGGRYPYKLQQRKGSYFPFLWCIVVRKQALVLLKTYGPKRYSLLNIWKLALFDQYSPGAFLSNWSSNCWIILIKTIKGNHKHSFETICIDVWAF